MSGGPGAADAHPGPPRAGGAMARRAEPLEGGVGGIESALGLCVPVALEERARHHEPRVAELGKVVDAAVEELERACGMALSLDESAGVELHLRQRGHG